MNRRLLLLSVGVILVAPLSLIANHPHEKPSPSKKDCKCGPKCRDGKCSRGCKCKCDSRCGKAPHMGSPRKPNNHPSQRGSYQRPSRGRGNSPSRGRGNSPSRGRDSSPNPDRSRGHHTDRPSPQSQIIVSKFDKNKDGRLDETERNEARKYFISRYRNHKK